MKTKLITIMFLLLVGCGEEEGSTNGSSVTSCSAAPAGLSTLTVGDDITSPELAATFATVSPSIYQSGSYCNKNYLFSQYHSPSADWCYYYSIDVDCSTNLVTSIYGD